MKRVNGRNEWKETGIIGEEEAGYGRSRGKEEMLRSLHVKKNTKKRMGNKGGKGEEMRKKGREGSDEKYNEKDWKWVTRWIWW